MTTQSTRRLATIAPRLAAAQTAAEDDYLDRIRAGFTPDANDWQTVALFAHETARLGRYCYEEGS